MTTQSLSRGNDYVKVANYPGLYRSVSSQRYLGMKKVNGRRRERSLNTTDRKIAERRMTEWVRSLSKIDVALEKTTLRQLCARFLKLNQGKAKGTQDTDRALVKSLKEWWPYGWDIRVSDIRTSQLEEWLALHEGRLRNTNYNRYTGFLKQLFEIAVKDRVIIESPFAGVRTR